VLPGYLITATTQLNASALSFEVLEVLALVGVCVAVTVPFVAVGLVVASILSNAADNAGRLYATDLVGAGLACAISIPLLEALDPPRVIALGGVALAAASVHASTAMRTARAVAALVAVAHALPLFSSTALPDPVVDRLKGYETFREQGLIRTTRWDPVFRVDVADHPEGEDLFLLFHDGSPGSGMRPLRDRDRGFPHLDTSSRRLPFAVLGAEAAPRVLIIGSAGGHEVVASLHFGASHVTGVELNTSTLDLLTGEYADITGRLHEDPRVTFVHGDGRWFLSQTSETYDLIWFVAPDSYAAMNASTSGAYVLAESYLYTVETLVAALQRLSPAGLLCAQFGEFDYENKPNRTIRFISTAREAFRTARVPNFTERILISTSAGLPQMVESTIVLSKSPFGLEQIGHFEEQIGRIPGGEVRFHHRRDPDPSPVSGAVLIPKDLIGDWYRSYPYLIDPVLDESPFFWHFSRFRDALGTRARPGLFVDFEDAVGERVLAVLLLVAILLGFAFLLLPMVAARNTFAGIRHKGPTAAYFASLGLGFMFVEITLIQKLTLLLGYPTRSLTVTLLSLLVSSGAGSYLSTRYPFSWQRALGWLYAALVILTTLWLFAMPRLIEICVGAPLPARIAVSLLATAPMGLCLGGFLPIGIRAVSDGVADPRPVVAWAWAVNAFASVVASMLAAILAMVVGFKLLIIAAPVIYAAGILGLLRIVPPLEAAAPEP
jgi:hypothetical protein